MRRPDESGSALVELTWLGILLLVPMIWIVLSVFRVQAGAFGTSAAARAAGRAFVLAPTDSSGLSRAREAARQALADQDAGDAPLTVRVSCRPVPGECHTAGSVITVTVDSAVRLPLMPSVFGGAAPSFALHATQTLGYGQFRESQ